MGQHARYIDQDGVNVVHIHVDIADPQESADMENNLYHQLYVSLSSSSSSSSFPSLIPFIKTPHLHFPPFSFQPLFFSYMRERKRAKG